jgi:F-type H+-transporting ATPase subunit b
VIDLNATFLIQWGIFIALMIFLHFYLFKPVLRVIDARQAKVEGTFASAKDMRAQATKNQDDYESSLAASKEKLFARTTAIREGAAKESRDLMDRAREEAMAQVAATKDRVRQDIEVVRKELVSSVDGLAREIASKVLDKKI